MKKERSHKRSRILIWLLIACALGLLALIPIHQSKSKKSQPQLPDQPVLQTAPVSSSLDGCILSSNLMVEKTVSWSDSFVEDGTDEAVSGVFALILKNTSSRMLQYAELSVTCGGEEYAFQLSTVPAGQSVLVQEVSRKPIPKDLTDASAELTLYADFPEEPGLCPEQFDVFVDGNQITVKNKTDQLVRNVYVYYKTFTDGQYLGGITYRAKIDQIAGGGSGSVTPAHYMDGSSQLMFITYVS